MTSTSDRMAILALQADWVTAERANDSNRLRQFMCEDITLWPDDGPAVTGIDVALAAAKGPFPIREIVISDEVIEAGPVHGWKSARFTTHFDNAGETVTVQGRHLWVLRRESTGWKLAGLSWQIDR
ncbi:YybH family protein [Hyphobacterium marinum]|uniref:Nuclear transport factor 2 family protein n=1 Tax=Hyphobacterium marinum TaxID=3116574 RepID=A0ABU7LV25_9PROT|nr:nuclear transport factor 2 family protein [Hyphobacterium sp. Y6023]MEE2565413.1 nuclear transport factor 2 family protein [Hyphobacterium sp. Y6023]